MTQTMSEDSFETLVRLAFLTLLTGASADCRCCFRWICELHRLIRIIAVKADSDMGQWSILWNRMTPRRFIRYQTICTEALSNCGSNGTRLPHRPVLYQGAHRIDLLFAGWSADIDLYYIAPKYCPEMTAKPWCVVS